MAEAASFDCAQARAPLERRICADPRLSEADSALGQAYAQARAAAADTETLRRAQQDWLRARAGLAGNDALLAAYRERTQALLRQAGGAAANSAPSPESPAPAGPPGMAEEPAALARICVDAGGDADARAAVAKAACMVDEAGTVAGSADPVLRYQLQSWREGDLYVAGGFAILAPGASSRPVPVMRNLVESAHFGTPAVVASPAGPLLDVPGSMEGTGIFSAEQLWRRTETGWSPVDLDSWIKQLADRLPKGLGAWKGIYPKWQTMTAETPLWRDSDGNCCPTGGSARIRLRLDGTRLVLDGLDVSRKPLRN